MSLRNLDLYTVPLQGINLIEASAGTGKTFTITGLYLRLVTELALPVERILVITYTNAATAELRERIRNRLTGARQALERGHGGDAVECALLEHCADPERVDRLLQRAILDFDRAAIFTIHGFCQRVLADSAFESAMPFETEMITDEQALLQEVVDDFWRQRVQDLPPDLLARLPAAGPDDLLQLLRGRLGKPYLELRGGETPVPLEPLEADYRARHAAVRAVWQAEGEEIARLLLESDSLNRSKYRSSSLEQWLQQLAEFLRDPPGPWFDKFEKFTTAVLADAVKKGKQPPAHPFFDRCEELLQAYQALDAGYRQAWVALQRALIEYSDERLRVRKAQLRIQGYDDLLLNLADALNGDAGPRLAAAVRQSYGAALIDEFQDTDPIQYQIIRQIYGGGELPLFLVGDPKQAIYSFRGADIFAYLRARREAQALYGLETNWRSHPALLAGVNELFEQPHASFLYDDIPFYPAQPAARQLPSMQLAQEAQAEGLEIVFLSYSQNKEAARRQAVVHTADEIARLLSLAAKGEARLGDRPLAGGDIAVLVRTHGQGALIREALLARGVHSVERGQESVFHSEQAVLLERLLRAVLDPGQEALLRAALASPLFGLDGQALDALGRQEAELEQWLISFGDYHRLWRERGFMAMFQLLLRQQGVAARLLSLQQGERALTDLLHLAELLHRYDREVRPGMEGLIKWLTRQRQAEKVQQDEHQLRLESDADLVQIVTVHKSKGLEYPLVFCPFVWEPAGRRPKPGEAYSFHDPEQDDQAVLELGSDAWERGLRLSWRERMAEELRLLYVALTRASHRCVLYWGRVKTVEASAMAWLLHPPAEPAAEDALEQLKQGFKALDDHDLLQRIRGLAGARVSVCPEPSEDAPEVPAGPEAAQTLQARRFTRRFGRSRRVTSFSALVSGHDMIDLPDYDSLSEEVQEPSLAGRRDRFHFPRGAQAGSALHTIFERLDFTDPDGSGLPGLVSEKLTLHGIDDSWAPLVCDWVRQVLSCELEAGSGLRLNRVTNARKLVEMGFHYPLDGLVAGDLADLLRQHGLASDPHLAAALTRLDFTPVAGFMKGFIDLIFEQDGRYYLLDYKSNWLGDETAAYAPSRLAAVMARDDYYLQYLFYTLALHRYLRLRLPDYDYERHFGAVYYLFLRGMDPASPGAGVYRDRPSKRLVEALDHYVDGLEGTE